MADLKKISNFSDSYSNSLSYYLNQISKIPLLTREEEEDLARKAKNGNVIARERLIRANLRFVVAVAKKYKSRGISLSDLINEGNIGLMKAIEKYDVDRGYHFISYAVWWIKQSILKAICEKSRPIRLPLNRANELVQIERKKREIETKEDESPTSERLANELKMDHGLVRQLMEISRETVSLDTPVYQSSNSASFLGDFITDLKYQSPDDSIESSSLSDAINGILDTLTEKEREIIVLRFGLNGNKAMSLKEIGNVYKLTKERIRQIEKKALVRMRHNTRSVKLRNFVEA
ncbi:MAG: RNA polymerase subunit sigma [Spirochaetes bacterium GWF1_31_7]|nr:MAG: RNA polymerase subunit sigma [Spirochaetes bacterium GWE1_32_154]OHD50805.1 MAG: RNA polymerase subunit sigma [Spirochaetes bacterium GWE2_31_10]OHD52742.1 MAG: RNA polymerase subunit sigma [Spirochaetes bacterium GWF1_31_7]HBD95417.1 RNA polymerase subunit sigma [Spirochaetia bacterium]HBI36319.1 RNA polymerase subunit sigma [Spirochaetia bacterium]